jgi:hypothetical protein
VAQWSKRPRNLLCMISGGALYSATLIPSGTTIGRSSSRVYWVWYIELKVFGALDAKWHNHWKARCFNLIQCTEYCDAKWRLHSLHMHATDAPQSSAILRPYRLEQEAAVQCAGHIKMQALLVCGMMLKASTNAQGGTRDSEGHCLQGYQWYWYHRTSSSSDTLIFPAPFI